VLKELGLLNFIKQQPNGINTILYPEGQQIPFTVSRRIVLARAIIHTPKLLLLKDPLEHFEKAETERIIKYLTAPQRPWALVLSTRNTYWESYCNQTIKISDGKIISNNKDNA